MKDRRTSTVPRKRFAPRLPPPHKYGANRSALSSSVDIFESAVEVFQETILSRPARAEAANVQRLILNKTLNRVVFRGPRDGNRQSEEKLVLLMLFHLDADFVKPHVSFEVSQNAEYIQHKCYDAAVEWLSLRATLPAVLTEHEVECEKFLSFAFIRTIYARRPGIDTKKEFWDMMAILGLKEYLYSTPAIRAVFRKRIAQIYATAVDTLEREQAEDTTLSAAVAQKTLDALRRKDSHGGLSWAGVIKGQKKVALHTIEVLLYQCEVIPPAIRVAVDDLTLAMRCAEAATRWKHARDSTGPYSSIPLGAASSSATKSPFAFSSIAVEPRTRVRSSSLPPVLSTDIPGLPKATQQAILNNLLSSRISTKWQHSHTADAAVEDVEEYSEAGSELEAPRSALSRVVTGTSSPARRVRFDAVHPSAEDRGIFPDLTKADTIIRHAVEIYAIVDESPPAIDDVPSVPLHWHFVHDYEDFWLSRERGQKAGVWFGVSLESLRIKHWPRMNMDQKKEASRLRALTVESFKVAKKAIQDLREEVSGTNIVATIATHGSEQYPDRPEKVPVPFTELCHRHLGTLEGDKKARIKRSLAIAKRMQTINGNRQEAQVEHLRANGDYDTTWKELRDAFIRDCAGRGETVLGRGLDEAV